MHIEARLFEFLTGFFVLSAVVYGVLTAMFQYGGVEWAGTTALILTAGLTLITGTFFRFVARRPTPGPRTTRTPRSVTAQASWAFQPAQLVADLHRPVGVDHGRGVALWLPWLIVAGVCFVLTTVGAWCSSTTPEPRSTDAPRLRVGPGRRERRTGTRSQSSTTSPVIRAVRSIRNGWLDNVAEARSVACRGHAADYATGVSREG